MPDSLMFAGQTRSKNLPAPIDKNSDKLISNFLSSYSNKNTIALYHHLLSSYFQALEISSLYELVQMIAEFFDELVSKSSQYILNSNSPNTSRTKYAVINKFWKWLLQVYRIRSTNPIIRPVLPKRERKCKTKSLPEKKLKNRMRKMKKQVGLDYLGELTYCLAYLMGNTSIRISEALQTTVDIVEGGILRFTQKGGEYREIALPKKLQQALLDFCNRYHILKGPIFLIEGKRKEKKTISRNHAYELLKRASGIGCHGYRKSAIEIGYKKGATTEQMRLLAGHVNGVTTERYNEDEGSPTAQFLLEDIFE